MRPAKGGSGKHTFPPCRVRLLLTIGTLRRKRRRGDGRPSLALHCIALHRLLRILQVYDMKNTPTPRRLA